MKRRILLLLVVAALVGLTLLLGFLDSPEVDGYLRGLIVDQAAKQLGLSIQIGSLDRDIFLTRITLQDVTLAEVGGAGGRTSVRRVAVEIDPYALLRGRFSLREFGVEGLEVDVVRLADGRLQVEPLSPLLRRAVGGRPGERAPAPFGLGRVVLSEVRLRFRDEASGTAVRFENLWLSFHRGRFDPPEHRVLSLSARDGRLTLPTAWRGRSRSAEVPVEALQAVLTLTPQEAVVSRLSLRGGAVSLQGSGRLPRSLTGPMSGSLEVDVDLGALPWDLGGALGEARLEATLTGAVEDPSLQGRLLVPTLRLGDRVLGDVAADVALDVRRLRLGAATARYRGEALAGRGELGFGEGLPFTVEVSLTSYPIDKIAQEFGTAEPPRGGYVSAEVRLEGGLSGAAAAGPWRLQAEGGGVLPFPREGETPVEVELDGALSNRSLLVERVEVRSESLALEGSGFLDREGFALGFRGSEEDLSRWPLAEGEALGGRATFSGDATGPWSSPRGVADLSVQRPTWRRFSADAADARLEVSKEGVDCPLGTVKAGSSILTVSGHVPWGKRGEGPRVSVEIPRARVEELLEASSTRFDAQGDLTGRLDVQRTPEGWTGRGEVALARLAILGEKVDRLSADLRLEEGLLRATRLEASKGGRRLRGEGRLEDGRFYLRLETQEALPLEALERLRALKVPLEGEVEASAECSGRLDGGEFAAAAALHWKRLTFMGRSWRSGKGSLQLRERDLEARAELLDGRFDGHASVRLAEGFPFLGSLRATQPVTREDLNDLLGLGLPSEVVGGRLVASADAEGLLSDLGRTRVQGLISEADVSIRGLRLVTRRAATFTYTPPEGITFRDLALASAESRIDGTLRIGSGGVLEGTVGGEVDLQGLTFLAPVVDSLAGKCGLQLKVRGSLGSPDLQGVLELRKAACVAHIPFALPVEGLEGRLEVLGNRLHVAGLAGRTGRGTVSMDGNLAFRGVTPAEGELRWKAEGVAVAYPEGLTTVDRAQLELRFSGGKGTLRGTVLADEGLYRRPIDIDNLLALIGGREEAPVAGEAADGDRGAWLGLDVEMTTVRPIEVDLKLLRGTASGTLRLQGTAARPVLSGRLDMESGTLFYRGKTFELSRGYVGFFNPRAIEPRFDMAGRTTVTGLDREGAVRDYVVDIVAVGVPSHFRLDLLSNPPLSEVDTLSLLTWGVVGERAMASGQGLSAAEATLLLTRQLRGTLESGIQRLTGLDRVVINPSAVSASGERAARIQVDKRMGERLSLTYSTPLLSSEETDVTVRYRVTERLGLVGSQAGEGDFGLDLDFQYEIP